MELSQDLTNKNQQKSSKLQLGSKFPSGRRDRCNPVYHIKENVAISIKKFTELSPSTSMSRFQEKAIYNKIQARGLETVYPQLLTSIMNETKLEYLQVTLQAGSLTKIKSEKLYAITPYKHLGKTPNYSEFLTTRETILEKLLLPHLVMRDLLNECVSELPYELFNINLKRNCVMDLNDFEIVLEEKLNECSQVLNQFYNKILIMINKHHKSKLGKHVDASNYLGACTGLLSVHISRTIAHTMLHVVNFTDTTACMPYLKLNVTFKDGLILNPTADDVINTFNKFIENIINVAKELHSLESEQKIMYLCLTDEFMDMCRETIAANIGKLYEPIQEFLYGVNKSFEEIYSHIGIFNRLSDMLFEEGCKKITFYKGYLYKIVSIIDVEFFKIGQVFLCDYRQELHTNLHSLIDCIFENLCAQHFWESNDICETFQFIYSRARQIPSTTEELIETGKYMTWVKDELLEVLDDRVSTCLQLLTQLIMLESLSDDHITINSNAMNWPEKIQPIVEQNFVVFDQLKFEAEEKLQKATEDMSVTINGVKPLLVILDEMDNISKAHVYLHEITLHMRKIKEIEDEISWINKEEVCLSFPKSSYVEFDELKNYVYPFYHLLKISIDIQRYLSVWLDGQFELLVYEEITVTVERFSKEFNDIQKAYKKTLRQAQDENSALRFRGTVDDPDILNWPAPLKLCSKAIQLIDSFKPSIKIIAIMCNGALRKRHWKTMSSLAGYNVTPNAGTTLRKIIQTDLKRDWSQYEIISVGATKEKQLKDKLLKLANEWNAIKFAIGKYKSTDFKILVQFEDIIAVVDDQTTKLINLRGSVFVQPHEKDVKAFLKTVENVRKTVEGWQIIQEQWLKLRPIFNCQHIQEILHKENELFDKVDDFYIGYIKEIQTKPIVMELVKDTDILENINISLGHLEKVNKGVIDYLEKVRGVFPRFFFLSNDELIDILSNGNNLRLVETFCRKLFRGLDKFIIDECNPYIISGVLSPLDEPMIFHTAACVETLIEYPEKYLLLVESQIKHCLEQQIAICHSNFVETKHLYDEYSQQTVQVVSQIYWTRSVENALNFNGKLCECLQQIEGDINEKCKLVVSQETTSLERVRIRNLIVQSINTRAVVKSLMENREFNLFLWEAQLKYCWENEIVQVKTLQTCIGYSHEYWGNMDEIVLTPLTDRCFRTLINSYYLQLNGLLKGPTGVGKTETIKNLAKAFGIMLVELDCSPDFNYKIIGRFLKGAALCGMWLCLKNIDKVPANVLSVVAQDISAILTAAKSTSKVFYFIGDQIKLNPTCFICSTINITHRISRSLLPDNLRVSFRAVAMMRPDSKMITDSTLHSCGFNQFRLMSSRIIATFNIITDILSNSNANSWYFGLRSIKSVLMECNRLKQKLPNENENIIVASAIKNTVISKLSLLDLSTFEDILCDVFGTKLSNEVQNENLEDIINHCVKSHLDPSEYFLKKLTQTCELLNKTKQGQILVGGCCTGKTTTIKIAAAMLSKSHGQIKCQIINPNYLTYEQLYGTLDPITFQWSDGVITKALRNFTYNEENQRSWLIFDGLMNPIWMENINGILGDKKSLCLASGETILLNNPAILFEVNNLSTASPSTISRCGIIYFDSTTVSWRAMLTTWLSTVEGVLKVHSHTLSDLFNWIIPACLEFMQTNSLELFEASDQNLTKNILQLTKILLENAVNDVNKKDDDLKNITTWIQATVAQAVSWGLNCALDYNSRMKFDEFYKQLWKGQNQVYPSPKVLEINIPQEGSVMDYLYIYKQRGSWKSWSDMVKYEKVIESVGPSEYLVPTVDTMRCLFVLKNYIKYNYPIVINGPSGVGKTMLIQHTLIKDIDKTSYDYTSLNIHRILAPKQIQEFVLSKLNRDKYGNYRTSKNKTCIIFIDDLNLNSFVAPATELLRQHLDHKSWYDLNNLSIIYLNNVYFLASMNLPLNNPNNVCPRFLKHFSIFSIREFTHETVLKIYTAVLQSVWKKDGFPNDVTSIINTVVSATFQVFQSIKNALKPTLTKCLYVFNLNDFCKVIQGCGKLRKETYDSNKKIYLKLWLHEVLRTFGDRINNTDDKNLFLGCVKDALLQQFKDELNELFKDNQTNIDCFISENVRVIFGWFPERNVKNYEEIPINQLYEIAVSALSEYNAICKYKLNIVLFEYALEHLAKICRIITTSNNHALLIGLSGSGRETLTKLACFMHKQKLFQPDITQFYDLAQWKTDVKTILKDSGCCNQPSVFLLSEQQIIQEEFLQYIEYVLKTNEMSNLFDRDEKQEILELVRLSAQGGNRNLDISSHSVFLYFNTRCKGNLHVVLCLSPIKLRNRLNQYPGLMKCNIISFTDWPDESLKYIAETWLKDVNIDDNFKLQLPKVFRYFHRQAQILAGKPDEKIRCYVTTNSYTHLIKLFIQLVNNKQTAITARRKKFQQGLDKLSFASKQIADMQRALAEYQPQLEEMTRRAIEMTQQIASDTIEVEEASALVRKDEKIAHEQATVAQILKLECEADLAQAIPILEDAISALNTLKPSDITLVKSMKNPPDAIKLVMAAVCVIKDVRPDRIPDPSTGRKTIDYWGPSKRILGDMNFLQTLKDFDKDHIKPEIMLKIRKEYLPHKDFKPHVVAKASSAAEGLCKWIIAMDMYDKVAKEVAPKKEKLEKAEREYAETMSILNQKKEQVARIEEKLAALNVLLQDATKKQRKLQLEVDKCNRKLQQAQKLIGGLSDEKIKWTHTAENLLNQYNCLTGDILLSAGLIVYLSSFQNTTREIIIIDWYNHIQAMEIPCTQPEFDLIKILSLEENETDYWIFNGLPNEHYFIINAMIEKFSQKYTIFIDPQYQAGMWIENMEKQNNLTLTKLTQRDYLTKIKDCIVQGKPILLQIPNNELPTCLYDLLRKNFYMENNEQYLNFNNEPIKFNQLFKLYIVSSADCVEITPELSKIVTVINFKLTQNALEDILVKIVVDTEKPQYKKLQYDLNKQSVKHKAQLMALDEKILLTLSKPETDILEDEEVVRVLDESKDSSTMIRQKQQDLIESNNKIIQYKLNYTEFASYASILYFHIDNLKTIRHVYQFSLDWFKNSYFVSILNAPKANCFRKRCENLITSFTFDLHKNVTRSLFEKDKLLFSFLLCVSKLTLKGEINKEDYFTFITGPIGKPPEKSFENPVGDLLTKNAWEKFSQIENIPFFHGFIQSFIDNINYWRKIFYENILFKEAAPPEPWNKIPLFYKLMILRYVKSDYLLSGMVTVIEKTIGKNFITPTKYNLSEVYQESYCLSPIIFILSPDVYPIKKLINFVQQKKCLNKFRRIALGDGQATEANKLIDNGQTEGWWVLLENCHLSSEWQQELNEKILQMDYNNTHENFRLLITTEPTNKIPIVLLQNSIKIIDESPSGFREHLSNLYEEEPIALQEFFNGCPGKQTIFTRTLYIYTYIHVLMNQRLKYGAMAWGGLPYEIPKANFVNCIKQLQILINSTNYSVKTLNKFIYECNYSEVIDNEWDKRLLEVLLKDVVETKFALPVKNDYQDFLRYITKLDDDPKETLGIHPSVVYNYQRKYLSELFGRIGASTSTVDANEDSKITILNKVQDILGNSPKLFKTDQKLVNAVVLQEMIQYNKLLKIIRTSLMNLQDVLTGAEGNVLMFSELIHEDACRILDNKLPNLWLKYSYPTQMNLSLYMQDLTQRCNYFTNVSNRKSGNSYWLSAFYYPKALLSWAVLNYSRKFNIALDDITFDFSVTVIDDDNAGVCHDNIIITGLFVLAAALDKETASIVDLPNGKLYDSMPAVVFKPMAEAKKHQYKCPLFKISPFDCHYNSRYFIASVFLKTNTDFSFWIKRSVVLVTQINTIGKF